MLAQSSGALFSSGRGLRCATSANSPMLDSSELFGENRVFMHSTLYSKAFVTDACRCTGQT